MTAMAPPTLHVIIAVHCKGLQYFYSNDIDIVMHTHTRAILLSH